MKTKSSPTRIPNSHDEIARRAHALWIARGSPTGSATDDWLEAERQLAHERTAGLHARGVGAADDIDEDQLDDRLADFGEPERRSITSADPT